MAKYALIDTLRIRYNYGKALVPVYGDESDATEIVNSAVNDAFGVDAEGVQELAELLKDLDPATGVLPVIVTSYRKATSAVLPEDLATVATSGSYDDLINKPDIPAAVAVKGDAESSYRIGNVNITPANIGLENVGNFKAVSTVASQGLTDTEKSNARSNIGAGTSSFSGSYNDLSNKPTNVSAFTNDAGYVTADLTRYKDVYIGVTAASTTIISNGYHHDSIVYGKPITINNANGYIWVILPAEYEPTVAMSLVEVPMTLDSTTTISSKSYKIWKSANSYTGNFNIQLF